MRPTGMADETCVEIKRSFSNLPIHCDFDYNKMVEHWNCKLSQRMPVYFNWNFLCAYLFGCVIAVTSYLLGLNQYQSVIFDEKTKFYLARCVRVCVFLMDRMGKKVKLMQTQSSLS